MTNQNRTKLFWFQSDDKGRQRPAQNHRMALVNCHPHEGNLHLSENKKRERYQVSIRHLVEIRWDADYLMWNSKSNPKGILVRLFVFTRMSVDLWKLWRFRVRFRIVHFAIVMGEHRERSWAKRTCIIVHRFSSWPMAKSRSFHCHYTPEGLSVFLSYYLLLSFSFMLLPRDTFMQQRRCRCVTKSSLIIYNHRVMEVSFSLIMRERALTFCESAMLLSILIEKSKEKERQRGEKKFLFLIARKELWLIANLMMNTWW